MKSYLTIAVMAIAIVTITLVSNDTTTKLENNNAALTLANAALKTANMKLVANNEVLTKSNQLLLTKIKSPVEVSVKTTPVQNKTSIVDTIKHGGNVAVNTVDDFFAGLMTKPKNPD